MKKGEIVHFYTSNSTWLREYKGRNPGVVISSKDPNGSDYDKGHAVILWADGCITREHLTYLKVVEYE